MEGTKGRDIGGLSRNKHRKTERKGAGRWAVELFGDALDLLNASCSVLLNLISSYFLG